MLRFVQQNFIFINYLIVYFLQLLHNINIVAVSSELSQPVITVLDIFALTCTLQVKCNLEPFYITDAELTTNKHPSITANPVAVALAQLTLRTFTLW